MNNNKVKQEFEWVIKVLKSSKNVSQVESSNNLFQLFQKKWSDSSRIEMSPRFNIEEHLRIFTKHKLGQLMLIRETK